MAVFQGQEIFASGPHRVTVGPRGVQRVLNQVAVDPVEPGSQAIGEVELSVTVEGRLVAGDAGSLQELRDEIWALLTFPAAVGLFEDNYGLSLEDMSFVRFEEMGPVDDGRVLSVPYRAEFVRFLS